MFIADIRRQHGAFEIGRTLADAGYTILSVGRESACIHLQSRDHCTLP
jgi:hypothetical protein